MNNKPATSRNLIESWCRGHKKKQANLTKDDYRQIISWSLLVGYQAGLKSNMEPSKIPIPKEIQPQNEPLLYEE